MGQPMTKDQKLVVSSRQTLLLPTSYSTGMEGLSQSARAPYRVTSATSRLQNPRLMSAGIEVDAFGQTFSNISARKFDNDCYLDVSIRDRDASCGGNSST